MIVRDDWMLRDKIIWLWIRRGASALRIIHVHAGMIGPVDEPTAIGLSSVPPGQMFCLWHDRSRWFYTPMPPSIAHVELLVSLPGH